MIKFGYTSTDLVYIAVGYASDDINLVYTAVGYARPISQLRSVHSRWVNNHSEYYFVND